ncbi:MAG: CoA-disulfide reductase, partial [Spirochaetales bacterium]|nr:CoA-disulfide reductase [Spirochaetales bacterium]
QTCGYKAADKRLDVIATAAACKMTIEDLSELDLSYSPPIGTANDPVNMAAFVAQNRVSGYSPCITVAELDEFSGKNKPAFIDVRDYFAFEKSHITYADHIPYTQIENRLADIPTDRPVLIYSDKGKKGHQVVRQLILKGYKDIYNIAGGYPSLERYARTVGFKHLHMNILPVEKKSIHHQEVEKEIEAEDVAPAIDTTSPIVVDVRSPGEFAYGAYPNAINIPLDYLEDKIDELGDKSRSITLYCASGARSGYGVRILQSYGFTNVRNGGGLMSMMAGLN